MIKFLLSFLIAFLAFQGWVPAQNFPDRGCAANEVNALLLKNNPAYANKTAQVEDQVKRYLESRKNWRSSGAGDTIPVVFHVIYSTPRHNISTAQILSQLQVLNDDFNQQNADTVNIPGPFKKAAGNPGIYFCLASLDPAGNPTTGITRTLSLRDTSFYYTENKMKFTAQGGQDAWMPELYLNIWIVNLADNILGYAQFPGGPPETDGVVLRYTTVGRPPFNPFRGPYNQGRTATHELGHWFGLRHIWGENENDCNDSDLISDTPNQSDKSSGCPRFPKISCNNGPNGDMFMNFMDYTNDNCMHLFTKEQSQKMNAVLQTSRANLLRSNMCSNKLNADFVAEPDAIFPGETTNFFYYPNGRRPTAFLWTFEGGVPNTSTERDPQNIYYEKEGAYTVTLTVSDAAGSDTETKIDYLKVTSRDLMVYPNPASTTVTVAAPAGAKMTEVRVFATNGKLVSETTLNQRTLQLDLRNFRNGLYIVQAITNNGNVLTRRLMVLR